MRKANITNQLCIGSQGEPRHKSQNMNVFLLKYFRQKWWLLQKKFTELDWENFFTSFFRAILDHNKISKFLDIVLRLSLTTQKSN